MGPLDQFNIIPYFNVIPGLSFTNSSLAMFVSCVLTVYIIHVLPMISNNFRILAEIYSNFIRNLCSSIIKHNYESMVPFVSSIFLFVLFGNVIGLVPGFFTFTSHMTSNLLISTTVIAFVLLVAIFKHGIRFLRLFAPSGVPLALLPLLVPIELISFFMRIFSLAIRLCTNMSVGHITIKVLLILASKFGLVGPVMGLIYIPFFFLEFGIACLQAYIFAILTCVYLNDAIDLH